jgi:hypothetical protein
MKHFILKEHSTFCPNEQPFDENSFFCRQGCGVEHFFIQFNFDFYLITYPSCLSHLNHLTFKEEILKQFTKKHKTDNIKRGVVWNEEFINNNDFKKLTNSKIEEVCYSYCDNAGKIYAFTNSIPYLQVLSIDYYKNINIAEDEISKIFSGDMDMQKNYIAKLKELMYKNAPIISNIQLHKSQKIKLIDLFTKKINQL